MKYLIVTLIALGLISSCNSLNNSPTISENSEPTVNCPAPTTEQHKIKIDRQNYGFYNIFNYQIRDIIADKNTIAFQSFSHQFIWCRGNNNWTIEPLNREQSQTNYNLDSANNNTIQFDNRSYEYAVRLDGNRAIFQLTTPESTQPQQQILYTLEQTKQAGAGIELAEPEISTALVYGDRLFWSIFTYHGEGFGGIATIVSYDPATKNITVIQPPEIANQIINDLVISGMPEKPIFWLATQLTGEGNPYIPSMGLVAYRPDTPDYTTGTIDSYRVRNSPIVGAIPTQLHLEEDSLWLGTGNGICEVKWHNIDNNDSWTCWQFALLATLPQEGLPIYQSLLDNTVDGTLTPTATEETVEVLWWSVKQQKPVLGRYEIVYEPGITVELTEGAMSWDEYYYGDFQPPVWESPVYWAGSNWHWERKKFVRGLDEVELNLVGGGPIGISSKQPNEDYIFDWNAMRGDLELLELTKDITKIKHYSAWVDDSLLQPYLTIIPRERSPQSLSNPLLEVKSSLTPGS